MTGFKADMNHIISTLAKEIKQDSNIGRVLIDMHSTYRFSTVAIERESIEKKMDAQNLFIEPVM